MRHLFLLAASLLPLALAADPYPEPSAVCAVGCQLALSKFTFAGIGFAPADSNKQACLNPVSIASLYRCTETYCTGDEQEAGIDWLSTICEDDGLPRLPAATTLPSSLTTLSLPKTTQVNSTTKANKNLTAPIIPDKGYFAVAQASAQARASNRYSNRAYMNAISIFWGAILTLATVKNFTFSLIGPQRPPWMRRVLYFTRSWDRPLRACNRPSMTRLELLVLSLFTILTIILCALQINPYADSLYYQKGEYQQVYQLVARRLSSMALINLPFIWLFSMRNNPLIYLTGWTFARFNQLHRWIARLTVLELLLHASLFSVFEVASGGLIKYYGLFSTLWWQMGLAAFVVLCFMLPATSFVLRQKAYEIFLVAHIVMAVAVLVGIWFHLAQWHGYFDGYLWPVVAFWALDRLARMGRFALLAMTGNSAANVSWSDTTQLLRVDITGHVQSLRLQPGGHVYLYTPTRLPFYPSHPFTLCAYPRQEGATDVQSRDNKDGGQTTIADVGRAASVRYSLLIRPANGFTQAWSKALGSSSVQQVPVLLEGPYGTSAPVHRYASVLVLVGGSGISVGLSTIFRALAGRTSSVKLVWACKNAATVDSIMNEELSVLRADPRLSIQCCVTGDRLHEKGHDDDGALETTQRPDVKAMILQYCQTAVGSIAVVTSGPTGMMRDAREGVARAGPSLDLDLFEENFCW